MVNGLNSKCQWASIGSVLQCVAVYMYIYTVASKHKKKKKSELLTARSLEDETRNGERKKTSKSKS